MTSRATLARTSRTRLPFTFPFRLRTTDSAIYSLGTTSTFRFRCSMAFLVAGPMAAMRSAGAKALLLCELERGAEASLFHGAIRGNIHEIIERFCNLVVFGDFESFRKRFHIASTPFTLVRINQS